MTTRRLAGHMGKIHVVEFNEDASVVASGKLLCFIQGYAINYLYVGSFDSTVRLWDLRAQNRAPIQILEEARDAVQTLHVDSTMIIAGSVDGHVRTYDLRKGELRSDYIGRMCRTILH